MRYNIELSADERSVILFCLESYSDSISDSDNTIDHMLGSLTLSKYRAQALVQEVYQNTALTLDTCKDLRSALWAWRITPSGEKELVSKLERKLSRIVRRNS